MKNYVRFGNSVPATAPAGGVSSGDGVLLGSLFGVATADAAEGEPYEAAVVGVFTLPKVSAQAWTVGQKIYWSAADAACTTTASGNTLIGAAFAPAANPSASGEVRLNGSAA